MNDLDEKLSTFQKEDWIFLLSLVTIYTEKISDNKGIDFWNFSVNYYKPIGFTQLERIGDE